MYLRKKHRTFCEKKTRAVQSSSLMLISLCRLSKMACYFSLYSSFIMTTILFHFHCFVTLIFFLFLSFFISFFISFLYLDNSRLVAHIRRLQSEVSAEHAEVCALKKTIQQQQLKLLKVTELEVSFLLLFFSSSFLT